MTTQPLTPEFTSPGTNETAAAVEAGQRIGRPVAVSGEFISTLNPITGETTIHDLTALTKKREREEELMPPQRKKGTTIHLTAESFIAYLHRHQTLNTELWATESNNTIHAHIDGDSEAQAGYLNFAAVLELQHSDAWTAWTSINKKYLDQEAFAEHVEARSIDIMEPTAADLLEIVSTIKQVTQVDFESAKRLSDGQTVLSYRETSNATAGSKGEFAVPEQFVIGIAPYEGCQPYRVVARLRTRVRDGRLHIGIVLERPDDISKAAFNEAVKTVHDNLPELPLFTGSRRRW